MEPEAHERVREVLASGYIGQGEQVDEFEEELAEFLGSRLKPVTTNSGTTAIQLAIEVMCGKGDGTRHILVPPLTCVATVAAIVDAGYKPRWMDYDSIDHRKMTVPAVDDRTAAMLLVDFAGYGVGKSFPPGDPEFGNRLPVIVDAAHGIGTDFSHIRQGYHRVAICYSFQAIKHLTTGDGGAVLFNHYADREKAVLHRWFGLDRTSSKDFRCEQNIQRLGHKWHMNDIAAAIGRANLKGLAADLKARRANASYVADNLRAFAESRQYKVQYNSRLLPQAISMCSWWVLPLYLMEVLDGSRTGDVRRGDLQKKLASIGIESSPVHRRCDTHPCMQSLQLPCWEGTPVLDKLADTILCVPCGPWMTDRDLGRMTVAIAEGW